MANKAMRAFMLPLVTAFALTGVSGSASALTVKFGQVGAASIDAIYEKGRFDRCAASFFVGQAMMRITDKFSVSVPTAPGDNGTMVLDLGSNGTYPVETTSRGGRTWGIPNPYAISKLLKVTDKVKINTGVARYTWPTGGSMVAIMTKVRDCARASR